MEEALCGLINSVFSLQREWTDLKTFGDEDHLTFGLTLITVASQSSRIQWNLQKYNKDYISSRFIDEIKLLTTCVAALTESCLKMKRFEINFFGDYNETIYLAEAKLFIDIIIKLTEGGRLLTMASKHGISLEDNKDYLFEGLSSLLYSQSSCEVLIRLFWLKYIGSVTSIEWSQFVLSFEAEYGAQFEETLDNFYSLLFPTQTTTSNSHSIVQLTDLFTFCKRRKEVETGSFSKEYISLFDAYQAKCSDQSILYLLGTCTTTYTTPTIMKSLLGLSIKQISCGNQHIMAITQAGRVYSWGTGAYGRLGHENESDISVPTLITALKHIPIESISCGYAFNIAIAQSGQVYSWGVGANGRLGLGDEFNRLLPCLIDPSFCDTPTVRFQSKLYSTPVR